MKISPNSKSKCKPQPLHHSIRPTSSRVTAVRPSFPRQLFQLRTKFYTLGSARCHLRFSRPSQTHPPQAILLCVPQVMFQNCERDVPLLSIAFCGWVDRHGVCNVLAFDPVTRTTQASWLPRPCRCLLPLALRLKSKSRDTIHRFISLLRSPSQ